LDSFAEIAAAFISFCRNTELPVYIRIAEALEGTKEDGGAELACATMKGVKEAFQRTEWLREPLSEEESNTATELIKGSRVVETPGAYDPGKPDAVPEPVALPEPMSLGDYVTAPRKHECGIFKQIHHAK
jgi:hypothetical protein